MQSNCACRRCFTCRRMILNQNQPGLKRKKAKIPQHQPVLFPRFWGCIAFPLKELEESEEVGGCVDLAVRQGSKCMQWWKADGQFRHKQTRRRQRLHLNFLGGWGLCWPIPPDLMSGYLKRRDSQDPGACWWSRRRRKRKKKLQVFSTRKALCSCRRKKNKINSLKSVSNGSSSSVEAATHVALHMYFWSPERTEEWRQTTRERLGTSFMFDAHGCAELEDDVGEETEN